MNELDLVLNVRNTKDKAGLKPYLGDGVGALLVVAALVIGTIHLESIPPLWWDEGWTLCVARNWVKLGHYGCLLNGEPAPPSLAGSFPVVVPIALSFRLFGVGIWQARIVGLFFAAGALALLYYLTKRLYNRPVATGTLIILLLLPVKWEIHPIHLGRQVLGEMPMLFYLLAGYVCFLLTQRKLLLFLPLALCFWGIALMTKIQVRPFWAISLVVPLAVALISRRWRLASLLAVGLVGSIGAFRLLLWGQRFLLSGHTLPSPPLNGLYDVMVLVLVPDIRLRALQFALTFGLPTLLGLGYATWRWAHERHKKHSDDVTGIVRLMLLILAGSWFAWFILLSSSWPRHAAPPIFIGNLFIAVLLFDLTGGFNVPFTLRGVTSIFRTRRFQPQSLKTICVVLLVAILVLFAVQTPFESYVERYNDSSEPWALNVIHFLNTATPEDALIETYDSELFFLLERRYHYPPSQVHVELIRRTHLGQDVPIEYDPLTADPDYLVVGHFSRLWGLYKPILATGAFRLIQTNGPYEIYERVR